MNTTADLERGHAAYSSSAWQDAYASLSEADRAVPLGAEDLELLATSAYMLGREDDCMRILGRAFQRHSDDGVTLRAARCAFWIGMQLALRGEMGPATGWLGRAQRLVEREDRECAEQGYMLMPVAFQHEAAGDFEGAAATAGAAAEFGERFGDADLFALAVHAQGGVLVKCGRVGEGLALLDEAMVTATAGELSPIVTGIVYCGVILACEEVYELRRAQEWTAVLARWCEQQPDLVAFTGRCLVHRAQLMHLHGDWRDALEEAQRAGERFELSMNEAAAAKACYLRGEVHRLRGEFAEAEESYREASQLGLEPQPGWALLRLAQGNADAAAAAIRRAIGETTDRLKRAGLLPAYVEILIAVGDLDEARLACAELEEIAAECNSAMLEAIHGHARGAVELAAGDASTRARESSPGRAGLEGARGSLRGALHACARRASLPRARRRGCVLARVGGRARCCSNSSARLRILRGGRTHGKATNLARHTACRRVSWRCCGWSRPARATGRSPASS